MADEDTSGGEQRFTGIAAAPGVVIGKVWVQGRNDVVVSPREIPAEQTDAEVLRLEEALIAARRQLTEIQQKVSQDMGDGNAAVFDAHLLVLDDPSLIEEAVRRIRHERHSAEYAFDTVASQFVKSLAELRDEYLRERAADIRDVAQRVLRCLTERDAEEMKAIGEPCIVLAYDLAPADTACIDKTKVIGFCTDIGSKTSHTAIMARALGIPAVVGLHDASQRVLQGDSVLLDGYGGLLILNPSEQTLDAYGQLEKRRHGIEASFARLRDEPAVTTDGHRIALEANIEMPDDVPDVLANGADGVGLFRTEYLFINRDDLPSEEEQYEAYAEVAQKLAPRPVVIRTMDLGGDKFLSSLQVASEMNPFLGWRAIRFCLERTDVFRTQLRAIARASVAGNVKMMYPMISGVEELRRANAELAAAQAELAAAGIAFDGNMPVGAMIEVPSAAMTADLLAKECRFFSVGTNDLIQYSLAVDRVNERIAHLYQPTHPAIFRLLLQVVEAAHRQGIPVAVCGEMAGDAALVPLLIGLGVDELSASPPLLLSTKRLIRGLSRAAAVEMVARARELTEASEIQALSYALAQAAAPEVMELAGA
ncbi:MAG: phosphoenolpyruvate--protein phosphotransferase [Verrucomicrobiae bacterium]|nr:phosphoenolpyruvate--protein phosphotransferase [Verrucomicrobiae bacterium]